MLIMNFKPERIAFFRKLIIYTTILELLFLCDMIFDIFKL